MLRVLLFWSDDQPSKHSTLDKGYIIFKWKQTVGLFYILLHILPIMCNYKSMLLWEICFLAM